MEEVQNVTEIAKGISDFGAMTVMAATYLLISMLLMVAVFKWFKSLITKIIENDTKVMNDLLQKTDAQNDLLNDIADGMRPTTLLQIKSITNTSFDLGVERVCRLIKKVRDENHIIDHEATKSKIQTLLSNLHEDRNSRFDNISFRGHRLSHYTNKCWIEWVADVVEKEVYSETENHGRTFTNVEAVYARIRIDFYHKLNGNYENIN